MQMLKRQGIMGCRLASRMDPAAAAAGLPPGRASPRQGWASNTCAALLASVLLGKAKKAEGPPHWHPPPPSMKKISRPAGREEYSYILCCTAQSLSVGWASTQQHIMHGIHGAVNLPNKQVEDRPLSASLPLVAWSKRACDSAGLVCRALTCN